MMGKFSPSPNLCDFHHSGIRWNVTSEEALHENLCFPSHSFMGELWVCFPLGWAPQRQARTVLLLHRGCDQYLAFWQGSVETPAGATDLQSLKSSGSHRRVILPSRSHLNFHVTIQEGDMCRHRKGEVRVDNLPGSGQPPQYRSIWPKMSTVPKLRNTHPPIVVLLPNKFSVVGDSLSFAQMSCYLKVKLFYLGLR